ncbi:acyltransferase family protein [Segniliparus rotundus]|uniref:acyltransferase family protein n=1 Tax=Segniliparus rotundus TaxID=286802 RepID=UPI001FE1416B|nr:acyltransferase family protein [Segniliparus rotundus]
MARIGESGPGNLTFRVPAVRRASRLPSQVGEKLAALRCALDSKLAERPEFRPEIQGLRALAVCLVVLYHVWLGRVSGGVDVFFVLTGFFITGSLLRAARGGSVALHQVWARVVKRLFPAALFVLGAIIAAGILVLPESRWQQSIAEVMASAVYLENWRLAADSADYFAQHNEASVVQHFWSLSIQGQFYVVWPLLVVAMACAAKRLRVSLPLQVLFALTAAFVSSLLWSVRCTAADQRAAYFNSFTRVWEFAFGGLLVFVSAALTLPRWSRIVLGWAAIAALVLCGLVLRVSSQFPGYVALWPTTCAAVIVVAGRSGSRYGADRLLGSRLLRYVGDISYPLYLWHWPVLVFALILWDRQELGLLGGAAVIATSLLLSVLTHRFVERPAQSATGAVARVGFYRFGAVALACVLLAAQCWQLIGARKTTDLAVAARDAEHPGALALESSPEDLSSPGVPVPSMVSLSKDFAGSDKFDCAKSAQRPELDVCVLRSSEHEHPQLRLAVVGDSHVTQFVPALEPIVRERHWELTVIGKGACPFSTASETVAGDASCVRHNAEAVEEVLATRPDAVLTNGTRDARAGPAEQTPQGFVDVWNRLHEAGIRILAVRDNPRFSFSPARCVESRGRNAPTCGAPRASVLKAVPPYFTMPNVPPNVSFLDFSDYICAHDFCPPIVGNVYVYMDDNHLSGTYVSTMSPIMGSMIDAALAEQH